MKGGLRNLFPARDRSTASTVALVGLGVLLPAVAAKASRSLVGSVYKAVRDEDPPVNPAAPRVGWKDAMVWTVVTGVAGGLVKLAVRRVLAGTTIPVKGDDLEAARAGI
ncbi:MAG: DUF4235 domain-containing protein [Akkermansiaceae bacterium]|nr:DUF4235 domain-containing protein [Akkermansiaceae bacterium]NNM28584.1 DUF4235 domain-containing protein [Akkermansiaceae bacterium]